jgi:hypothetical protein
MRDVTKIIQELKASPGKPQTVCEGCHSILAHLHLNPSRAGHACEKFVTLGGLDAALKAMAVHANVSVLQEACCNLVGTLVTYDETHPKLAATGCLPCVVESVTTAMESHANVLTVQTHAMRALNFLAEHHIAEVSATNVIFTILSTMRRFPRVESIQEDACRSIWALCTWFGLTKQNYV